MKKNNMKKILAFLLLLLFSFSFSQISFDEMVSFQNTNNILEFFYKIGFSLDSTEKKDGCYQYMFESNNSDTFILGHCDNENKFEINMVSFSEDFYNKFSLPIISKGKFLSSESTDKSVISNYRISNNLIARCSNIVNNKGKTVYVIGFFYNYF